MATENRILDVNPLDWAVTDQAFIVNDDVIQYYDDAGDVFSVVGDGTSTVTELRELKKTIAAGILSSTSVWDSATAYSVIGGLVTKSGRQYTNINASGNTGKTPVISPTFWKQVPNFDQLAEMFNSGEPFSGGMSDLSDRAGANYQQNIAYGKFTEDGTDYDAFLVHLDGTQITGNTTLEAIFDVGGGAEYPFLDKYGPDLLGTRTLVDMGGRTTRAQSVSGKADILAEVQEDAMQKITGIYNLFAPTAFNGTGSLSKGTLGSGTLSLNTISASGFAMNFDSSNSILPNTSKTDDDETRMSNMVVGVDYIIVLKTA